jgi:RNA recognition motif-containing protein
MAEDQADRELKSLCKLFIGGIPRTITDEELAEHFLQFTEDDSLNDCVVIKDEMKNSRGFGFVTYNKLSDTDNCLANRPHNLGTKEVEVKHAIPRDEKIETNHVRTNKIFVGGLSKEATEEELTSVIENHVLAAGESLNAKITKCDIIKEKETGEPRGFAFLDMASEDDADKVVIVKHFDIAGRRVELKKAEPKGGSGGGRGGGSRGRGGRGARGGGGARNTSQFGGAGGWGFNDQYGAGAGAGGFAMDYGAYSGYGGGGYGFDSMGAFNQYAQQASSYGPSRAATGRYRGRNGPY